MIIKLRIYSLTGAFALVMDDELRESVKRMTVRDVELTGLRLLDVIMLHYSTTSRPIINTQPVQPHRHGPHTASSTTHTCTTHSQFNHIHMDHTQPVQPHTHGPHTASSTTHTCTTHSQFNHIHMDHTLSLIHI